MTEIIIKLKLFQTITNRLYNYLIKELHIKV